METIETIDRDEYRIEVYHDSEAGDPRIEFDCYSEEEVQAWKDGEVYGFVVTREDGEELHDLDSVWGFYCPDQASWEYMIENADDSIEADRTYRQLEARRVREWAERDVVTVGR